jgi:hypothetical protein
MKHFWLLPLLALGACADPHMPLNPNFGESVAANMAAQIINPVPANRPPPTTNGKRVGDAMQRYRTERVYPPIPPISSSVKEGEAPVQGQPIGPGLGANPEQ